MMHNGHDFKNDEFLRDELNNNIYPSLRDVVKNRYYILTGIFAYYAFRLVYANVIIKIVSLQILDSLVSLFFELIALHNICNYYMKSRVIRKNTKKDAISFCSEYAGIIMEAAFFIITISLIGSIYWIIWWKQILGFLLAAMKLII